MPGKKTLRETLGGEKPHSLMGVDSVARSRRPGFTYDKNALMRRSLRDQAQLRRTRRGQPSWTRHKFYKDNPEFLGSAKSRGGPIWKGRTKAPGTAFFRKHSKDYPKGGRKQWKAELRAYEAWKKRRK